ncbi:TetR/AcrR family transcriptional regulator C-terminal ligand-binding domain-containing protein [Saccharopolyspora taberi]
MQRLEARIAEVTRDCLDRMQRSGPPVDLVGSLALPVPSTLICELLGVPQATRGEFQRAVETGVSASATAEELQQASSDMVAFFAPLMRNPDHPDLAAAYGEVSIEPRNRAIRTVLEESREKGHLPPETDLEIIRHILSGAIATVLTTFPDSSTAQEMGDYFIAVLRHTTYRS